MNDPTDVLVVGAGPVGLTLACDLRRRRASVRIVEAAPGPVPGSRAKGLQPRTLEVFDDLGILEALQRHATTYPLLGVHLGPLTLPWRMHRIESASAEVPYPNTLMVSQFDTDACLRRRLGELGGEVEFSTRLTECETLAGGVRATVERDGQAEEVGARYLVGADGGSSTVRRSLGIAFEGETDEADRMIVADLTIEGLRRDRWHVWPRTDGHFMALCPLPGGEFQLMLRLGPDEEADLDGRAIGTAVERLGGGAFRVEGVTWASLFRPNVRLAARYRVGNCFLAGDAAHVHTPAGAQGLNTGVQDAYNLGWKLGQALAGAPDVLLASYEAERRPVAARVLGLSSELYGKISRNPLAAARRGDTERQLSLTYRGGPLSIEGEGKVRSGDRAPDAALTDAEGRPRRVLDILRGPHFTLLIVGDPAAGEWAEDLWPQTGAGLAVMVVPTEGAAALRRTYGLRTPAHVLIRPDGYVAYVATGFPREALAEAAARFAAVGEARKAVTE